MHKFLLALLILTVFVSTVVASDAAPSDQNGAQVSAAPAPPPPPPPTPEGTTWRTIVGNTEGKDHTAGVQVDFIMQSGYSVNNSNTPNAGGTQNFPNGEPGDTGFQLSGMWTIIHRDTHANMLPRITPIPPPMYKKFDWGFEQDVFYGRDGQPCRMAGWDAHWGINEPGASTPTLAASNRQNFLCTPNVWGALYLPIFKGITITGGRYGDGLGYEIPPSPTHGPNFFYSHSYAFYAENWQVLGVLASVNVIHSQKNGYLMAEFGVNNGEQTAVAASGNTMGSFEGALRWKSPHMATGIAYSFRAGDGNRKTNASGTPTNNTDFGPVYAVYSPKGLMRQRHNLIVTHEFDKHWFAAIEANYFKQDGGPSAFIGEVPFSIAVPGVFKGDRAAGINATATYRFNPKVAAGVRLETFNDPTGMFLMPLNFYVGPTGPALSKGHFNDFTAGINFAPVRYITIRPEIRDDWNERGAYGTSNAGVAAGTQKPLTSQLSWNMDMLIRF